MPPLFESHCAFLFSNPPLAPRSPFAPPPKPKLVVTDFFGNVFRFTTDSLVTVETLPKYGRLFAASSAAEALATATAAATNAVQQDDTAATTSTDLQITAAYGFDRHLGPCRSVGGGDRGDRSRNCPDTFGAGPRLSTRSLGAVAARNLVRAAEGGGAKFWYVPEEGYLGPDDFGFSVTVGGVKSEEAWVVGVHTRRFGLGSGRMFFLCGRDRVGRLVGGWVGTS